MSAEHDVVRPVLALAAAGEADAAMLRRIHAHIGECESCRQEWEVWQGLAAALSALPEPSLPVGLMERTQRRIEQERERRFQERVLLGLAVFGSLLTVVEWWLLRAGLAALGVPDLEIAGLPVWSIGCYLFVSAGAVVPAVLLGQLKPHVRRQDLEKTDFRNTWIGRTI